MKSTNRNSLIASISSKLSPILTKFADAATSMVGTQQLKSLLLQHPAHLILPTLFHKLDTSEPATQRQKKEHIKIYLLLIDTYPEDFKKISTLQKFIESLSKKGSGVAQVVSHLCKTCISKYQEESDQQNSFKCIINAFKGHPELSRVIKSVVQGLPIELISLHQSYLFSLLAYMLSKPAAHVFQSISTMILTLEERFTCEMQLLPLLLRFLKCEEWAVRKSAVDVCYALMVVKGEVASPVDKIVRQMKYDKIKHVRDSVGVYQNAFRQMFGDEQGTSSMSNTYVSQSQTSLSNTSSKKQIGKLSKYKEKEQPVRQSKITSPTSAIKMSKSPAPLSSTVKQQFPSNRNRSSSLDRSLSGQKRNEAFFKNAGQKDIIKINEQSIKFQHQRDRDRDTQQMNRSKNDFQNYLKDRQSPTLNKPSITFNYPVYLPSQSSILPLSTSPSPSFKKKSIPSLSSSVGYISVNSQDHYGEHANHNTSHLNQSNNHNQSNNQQSFSLLIDKMTTLMKDMENRIMSRLDTIQKRVDTLQKSTNLHGSSHISSFSDSLQSSVHPYLSLDHSTSTLSNAVESNVQSKFQHALLTHNFNEAFTLALTNHKRSLLMTLLQDQKYPNDTVIEECLQAEVRKMLSEVTTLKWLKSYIYKGNGDRKWIQKVKSDLSSQQTRGRQYQMWRKMLINEIENKLKEMY